MRSYVSLCWGWWGIDSKRERKILKSSGVWRSWPTLESRILNLWLSYYPQFYSSSPSLSFHSCFQVRKRDGMIAHPIRIRFVNKATCSWPPPASLVKGQSYNSTTTPRDLIAILVTQFWSAYNALWEEREGEQTVMLGRGRKEQVQLTRWLTRSANSQPG